MRMHSVYNVLVLSKQPSYKQTPETVSARCRITQIITQWVPGSQTGDSKCTTTMRAETVWRQNQVMTTGKMPSTGHIEVKELMS